MAAIMNMVAILDLINYYKSETFLMAYKTFVDNFIGLLQEIVLCRCLKRFFQSNRDHLGISHHCYLKTRIIRKCV